MDTLRLTLDGPSPIITQAAQAWFDGRPFDYDGQRWTLTLLNVHMKDGGVTGAEIGGELIKGTLQ
ncbi:hypothetical protein ACSBOB_01625 [Mesorhizobium sp. ASY16-5R]|uniref:hypothetical protein n=1 Tax=Mesorhizobium sp. ASY16-5R TaxID=3445772 RepID=UPI003FA02D33